MLKIDFDIAEDSIGVLEVTKVIDKVIEVLDKVSPDMHEITLHEGNIEFTISREDEDDYWEVDRIKRVKDGHTNKSIKA